MQKNNNLKISENMRSLQKIVVVHLEFLMWRRCIYKQTHSYTRRSQIRNYNLWIIQKIVLGGSFTYTNPTTAPTCAVSL